MIFQRAAIREFTHTAAGVFVALFAILMTTQLIRLLGDAAGGKLASEAVVALLGFRAIGYLPVLLSLTLFVAVLMTLSRWYRDSEMVVWLASGIPLTAMVKPVLKFVGPPVIVIAALSLFLTPWACAEERDLPADAWISATTWRACRPAHSMSQRGQTAYFLSRAWPKRTGR